MITFICEQVGWILMGLTLALYVWPHRVSSYMTD